MTKLIVMEDGDTYGGAENARIVEIPSDLYLEEYEDWSDVPAEQYRTHGTLGEIEEKARRTLRAWYSMDGRTEAARINGDDAIIAMDEAVWGLALALGIDPHAEERKVSS